MSGTPGHFFINYTVPLAVGSHGRTTTDGIMNKFLALTVFTRVADSGGFTAAARKLGMSVSAATKTIARLEDVLGAQFFNRTTRQLGTTDYGPS